MFGENFCWVIFILFFLLILYFLFNFSFYFKKKNNKKNIIITIGKNSRDKLSSLPNSIDFNFWDNIYSADEFLKSKELKGYGTILFVIQINGKYLWKESDDEKLRRCFDISGLCEERYLWTDALDNNDSKYQEILKRALGNNFYLMQNYSLKDVLNQIEK